MDSPSKCIILVPVYRELEPETESGLRELAKMGYRVEMLRGSSQIDLARSTLASRALKAAFEETMWIDADVVFDPKDVDKLRGHHLPFTAGLYVKKGMKAFAGRFGPQVKSATFGVGGGLVHMIGVGMGFTHIRARVFHSIRMSYGLDDCAGGYDSQEVVTPYFLPMIHTENGRTSYLSEDYSFCTRARGCSYIISADTTIRLGHIGKTVIGWDEFIRREPYQAIKLDIDQTK